MNALRHWLWLVFGVGDPPAGYRPKCAVPPCGGPSCGCTVFCAYHRHVGDACPQEESIESRGPYR